MKHIVNCIECNSTHSINVNKNDLNKIGKEKLVNIFPYLNYDEIELHFISQICKKCWKKIIGEKMMTWKEVKEELKFYYIDLVKILDEGYSRYNVFLNYDSYLKNETTIATIYEFENEYEIHYG